MDVIKSFKDIVLFVQKSNDTDMIQKVISAQENMLEMQSKIIKLQDENKRLKSESKIKKNIERYPGTTLVTLKNENPKIPYCSTCYGKEGLLIQLKIKGELCQCLNCKSYFYISESINNSKLREMFK